MPRVWQHRTVSASEHAAHGAALRVLLGGIGHLQPPLGAARQRSARLGEQQAAALPA